MTTPDPAGAILQKPFSSALHSKRLAKNPLLEAISLHGPMGPHQFSFESHDV
jgi:hypothetical protein